MTGSDGLECVVLCGCESKRMKLYIPFGIVETSSNRVTGFREKPVLDYKISSGHYAFTREAVKKYFPEKGNFEDAALPEMARDKVLYSLDLDGEWITVNNMKQLEEAKKKLSH